MPTTNTNFSSLITAIDTKAQSLAASTTDPKDLVFLGKAIEAINIPDSVSAIIAEGDTQVAAVNTAGTTQVGNVNTAGATQVAAVQAAAAGLSSVSELTVTVAGGKFVIDGTSQQALNLSPSVTYRFDVSDSTNSGHPLKFSTTADGTHGSGSEFTTGVTVSGTAGTAGAYVQIIVEQDSPTLYYYCGNHAAMGAVAYAAYNVLSVNAQDGEVLTFSAASGAYINTAASSGSGDTEVADPTLDTFSTNLQSAGKYMNVSNLNAYSMPTRIRGLDSATKAYGGINNMVRNGSTTGNMQHHFSLFSANQSTGAITFEASTVLHNNGSSSNDYSTFGKASDEWSGRHSYLGHIPRNSQGHNYGYDQAFIYNTSGAHQSNHTSNSTHYPHGNQGNQNCWIDPSEHRIGGAASHFIDAYSSSNSKAVVVEFRYNYSISSLSASQSNYAPFTTSITSTNYNVKLFNQYDVSGSANLPRYTAFHSFEEGLYARDIGVSGGWSNLGSAYTISPDWTAWFLSNGNTILERSGELWMITKSSGAITSLGNTGHAEMGLTSMNNYEFCWNIGTDEWLQALPDSRWCKFKFNPTTGAVTRSTNTVVTPALNNAAYDSSAHAKTGMFSQFNASTIAGNSQSFTFGTENSNGNGYGRSKLMHLGHDNSSKLLIVKTYDLSSIISTLTY